MDEEFQRPPLAPHTSPHHPSEHLQHNFHHRHDYSPLSWSDFFASSQDVSVQSQDPSESEVVTRGTFRVYTSHPLKYDEESKEWIIRNTEESTLQVKTLMVFVHGGGHTALSWATTAQKLRQLDPNILLLAYDMRGHGQTNVANNPNDLSLRTLTSDLISLLKTLFPHGLPKETILIGHSLGGSVAVEATLALKPTPIGVVVVDVVEGTAMESLVHMKRIIATRPSMFKSLDEAVEWSIHSGTLHNLTSARISIPPQLKLFKSPNGHDRFVWVTDLNASAPYWEEWFKGLSNKFLSCRCGKLLVLAGTDRLDTPLTIAQMQGKFQMVLYPECGHSVQEDAPDQFAEALIEFWKRNQPLDLSKIKKLGVPAKTVTPKVDS